MPIHVTCNACNQPLAAPESMAGKRAVCPNCKAVIEIPEQFVPAEVVDPEPAQERSTPPPLEQNLSASVDVTHASLRDPRAEEEKAALGVLRLVYLFFRDDWRRLPTCTHLWFGFALFFLPWVSVSCNSRMLVTQTGLQSCHGAWTVEPRFEKLVRNQRGNQIENLPKPNLDDAPSWSVLSIIYLTFLVLGGFLGLVCMVSVLFRFHMVASAMHLFSLGLGSAAFMALAAQMMIGFPVDKHVKQQIDKMRTEHERRNAQFGIRVQPNDPLDALDIETRYTPWLWWSVILASISTPFFVLEFVILVAEVLKKHLRSQGDSG